MSAVSSMGGSPPPAPPTSPAELTNSSNIKAYEGDEAKAYDQTRVPVGINMVIDHLDSECARLGKTRDQLVVGDFPSGSGLYAKPLHDAGFTNIVAFEGSAGMLTQLGAKIPSLPEGQKILGDLRNMTEVGNESVDIIICNQFVHHVVKPKGGEDRFSDMEKVFSEFSRVLRPKGEVVINFCTTEQTTEGFWYRKLWPEASRVEDRATFPDKNEMAVSLFAAGFTKDSMNFVPCTEHLQHNVNEMNVFNEKDRHGDSGWNIVDRNGGLNEAFETYAALGPDGVASLKAKSNDFVATKGASTFALARKP